MNIHRMTPEQILMRQQSLEIGCAGCDHHRPNHTNGFGCRANMPGWPDATNKDCFGWKRRMWIYQGYGSRPDKE